MTMFTVDDSCIKCGLCAELCIRNIIEFQKPDKPFVPAEAEANCVRCGQCVTFCPKSCCYLDFQPAGERAPVDAARLPDAETAELFLRSRRSVRKFKDTPVDEALVRRIMETVRYSPTASNSQLVRWTITKNREKTRELGGMVVDTLRELQKKIKDPVMAAKQQKVIDDWDNGVDSIFRTAPQLAIAIIDKAHPFPDDADLALTYFELAAHANGIGCCWAGFFTTACRINPEIRKAAGASDGEVVVGAQMFGYPVGIRVGHILPPRKKPDITYI